MANEKNLKRFGKEKPAPSSEEAVKNGRAGGKKSGQARAKAKTAREIVEMLDRLKVTGSNRDMLKALGVPNNMLTQQTLRIAALHKKAISGDVAAVRLLLEIKGEKPDVHDDVEDVTEVAVMWEDASESDDEDTG